ncbi:MAG: hypothetical protein QXO15_10700 [Nitrososphaerota archaeon]
MGWYYKGYKVKITLSTSVVEEFLFVNLFRGWTDEYGNIISTNQTLTFIADKSMKLATKWEKEINMKFVGSIIIIAILLTCLIFVKKKFRCKEVQSMLEAGFYAVFP